jgi:hypothetical protein
MATTTNYGWTTPDDTALVKDGASAIRSLGTSVDTTTKNLNPSTTLGDIEYRSSTANTNTRLGIGSTGNVLTVAGGVPTWAAPAGSGGMTLLSTTSLTGASTTVGSINQTYKDLIVVITGQTGSVNGQDFYLAPNGTTTIVHQVDIYRYGASGANGGVNGGYMNFSEGSGCDNTDANNNWTLRISNYAATDKRKAFAFTGIWRSGQGGNPINSTMAGGGINTDTAISSLVFSLSSGNLSTGTVLVYGVN